MSNILSNRLPDQHLITDTYRILGLLEDGHNMCIQYIALPQDHLPFVLSKDIAVQNGSQNRHNSGDDSNIVRCSEAISLY